MRIRSGAYIAERSELGGVWTVYFDYGSYTLSTGDITMFDGYVLACNDRTGQRLEVPRIPGEGTLESVNRALQIVWVKKNLRVEFRRIVSRLKAARAMECK